MMRRRQGGSASLWPWVVCGAAVLALMTGPATVQADQDKTVQAGQDKSDGDVEKRLERLEQRLKEKSEGARVGGHFGVVLPLVTWEEGREPVTLNDNTVVGFPVGITVKKPGPLAFDLEFVPSIKDRDVELTVHPGVLYSLGHDLTAGLRMAFDVRQNSWGFTPLLNRKLFNLTESSHLFIEFPVPIRIKNSAVTVTAALHVGIGF